MPKRQQDYKNALDHMIETVKSSQKTDTSKQESETTVMQAIEDMAKDEWSLITTYLKSDLKAFAEEFKKSQQESTDDPFYDLTKESIWEGLAEITDKTQIEWLEVFQDFEHKGVYEVDDVIGLGVLVCERCQHRRTYNHANVVEPCIECGHTRFTRMPLKP
ncbi:MAG: zinc ribbon-containing protein [Vibrio sp.]